MCIIILENLDVIIHLIAKQIKLLIFVSIFPFDIYAKTSVQIIHFINSAETGQFQLIAQRMQFR